MDVLYTEMPKIAVHARRMVVACIVLILCLLISPTHTANSPDIQISKIGNEYRIYIVMQMQVPAHYVHRVLTDYKHIYRLNPAIVDSAILHSPDDDVVRVRTRIADCIGIFCMEIDRVEDVRELDNGSLQATTISTLSDFDSGNAEWKIMGMKDRTQVIYQGQMVPDFFIPPLIGSYFIKQKLRQHMMTSLARIECIARIQAGLEQNPEPNEFQMAKAPKDHHAVVDATSLSGEATSLVGHAQAAGSTASVTNDCSQPCSTIEPPC